MLIKTGIIVFMTSIGFSIYTIEDDKGHRPNPPMIMNVAVVSRRG